MDELTIRNGSPRLAANTTQSTSATTPNAAPMISHMSNAPLHNFRQKQEALPPLCTK